jgi:hypothetical protein
MSHHNYTFTPKLHDLQDMEDEMRQKGAKVVKIATTANDITDAWTMISLLQHRTGSEFFFRFAKALCPLLLLLSACPFTCCIKWLGETSPSFKDRL